jgi:zinc transport system substrate-binding protein
MKKALPLFGVLVLVVAAITTFVLVAGKSRRAAGRDVQVAVSIVPYGYLVEQVGGDRVDVTVMIPPGESPATYEPTVAQVRKLEDAQLYVKVGHPAFPFEKAYLKRILRDASGLRVVDSSRGVDLIPGNPHVWLSPSAVAKQVGSIRDGLVAVDPSGAELYEKNARTLIAKIERLREETRQKLKKASGKRFYVFHPAWAYLAREFGLVQRALEKDYKKPGPRDVQQFIDEAKKRDVDVIFVQEQFDKRLAKVVAEACSAEVVSLDPLARDWLSNMRRVTNAIAAALR